MSLFKTSAVAVSALLVLNADGLIEHTDALKMNKFSSDARRIKELAARSEAYKSVPLPDYWLGDEPSMPPVQHVEERDGDSKKALGSPRGPDELGLGPDGALTIDPSRNAAVNELLKTELNEPRSRVPSRFLWKKLGSLSKSSQQQPSVAQAEIAAFEDLEDVDVIGIKV